MNLQKQLRCVYLHAFTSTLHFTDAVWVALLATRGFTLAQIGLAEGVFHGVSLLCEVPSGMAADLLGRRRTLIFGGALASLLAGVLTSAGYYLADAAVSAVSALAAANLTEPVVTDEQAAREKHILQELPARLRVHILDSLDCLCSSTPARRIIMADAVISLPSYLTSMFVQQRLTQQGWAMEWLFLPGLLAGAAGMAGASLGRRLHPKRLRALYFGCALLVGTGTLLAGAVPALLCAAGPVLVQGALSVWFLHSMQRLNDAIPSDRRATLISVDSMAYSLLMLPASPLVGLVGDLTGQAGAGLCVLCALVVASGLAAAGRTRYNGRGA